MANNQSGKGFVYEVEMQKSRGYAEPLEFLPALHCKKKSVQCTPNMVCYVCPVWNTLYGVKLCQIFGVCFMPNWVCFHTNSVCFPTNFSVVSHYLWRIVTLTQCAFPLTSVCFPTPSSVFSH